MKMKKRGKKNKRRLGGMRVCLCEDDAKACVRYARARSFYLFILFIYEIYFHLKFVLRKKGRREGRTEENFGPYIKVKKEKQSPSLFFSLFFFFFFLLPFFFHSQFISVLFREHSQIPTSKINLLQALFLFPLLKLSLTQSGHIKEHKWRVWLWIMKWSRYLSSGGFVCSVVVVKAKREATRTPPLNLARNW